MEIFLTLEKFHGKPNEKLQKKKNGEIYGTRIFGKIDFGFSL